jgi:hypothetical protein
MAIFSESQGQAISVRSTSAPTTTIIFLKGRVKGLHTGGRASTRACANGRLYNLAGILGGWVDYPVAWVSLALAPASAAARRRIRGRSDGGPGGAARRRH